MGKENRDGQDSYTIKSFESDSGDAEKSAAGEGIFKPAEGSDEGLEGVRR